MAGLFVMRGFDQSDFSGEGFEVPAPSHDVTAFEHHLDDGRLGLNSHRPRDHPRRARNTPSSVGIMVRSSVPSTDTPEFLFMTPDLFLEESDCLYFGEFAR